MYRSRLCRDTKRKLRGRLDEAKPGKRDGWIMFEALICLGFVSLMSRFGAWKNQMDREIVSAQDHALQAQMSILSKTRHTAA
jgi:hypothetical protein